MSTQACAADKFVTLYPGVYTERKPLVEQYIVDNKALKERGPVGIQALINGTLPKGIPDNRVATMLFVGKQVSRNPDARLWKIVKGGGMK